MMSSKTFDFLATDIYVRRRVRPATDLADGISATAALSGSAGIDSSRSLMIAPMLAFINKSSSLETGGAIKNPCTCIERLPSKKLNWSVRSMPSAVTARSKLLQRLIMARAIPRELRAMPRTGNNPSLGL